MPRPMAGMLMDNRPTGVSFHLLTKLLGFELLDFDSRLVALPLRTYLKAIPACTEPQRHSRQSPSISSSRTRSSFVAEFSASGMVSATAEAIRPSTSRSVEP
jgi:hypothetical protein